MQAAECTHHGTQRPAGISLPFGLTKGAVWGAVGSEGRAAPHFLGHSQRRFLAFLGDPCPSARKINREGKAWDKRHLPQAGGRGGQAAWERTGTLRRSPDPGAAGAPGTDLRAGSQPLCLAPRTGTPRPCDSCRPRGRTCGIGGSQVVLTLRGFLPRSSFAFISHFPPLLF